MNKRIWIVNLVCVSTLFGLGWKLRRDWRQYTVQNGPQVMEIHPLSGVQVPSPLPAPDYTPIARQNPFHAERNDVITEPAQIKVSGPPPLVYGSIIMGSDRFALMSTEQSPKVERVAEGGTFAGYRLTRVLPQSVVLDGGAGQEEIMFYNALERLHRQGGRTSAGAKPAAKSSTTSTGGGSTEPPAEVSNAQAAPSPQTPAGVEIPGGQPAPPGKQWIDSPFGPLLVLKPKQ